MRPETKKLIKTKTMRRLDDGSMQRDPDGEWIHARDIRSILNCETELLQKTCDKRKKEIEELKNRIEDLEFNLLVYREG